MIGSFTIRFGLCIVLNLNTESCLSEMYKGKYSCESLDSYVKSIVDQFCQQKHSFMVSKTSLHSLYPISASEMTLIIYT